jgi:GT2 family glycosyltransferase
MALKVSILIPCYGRPNELRDALRHVLLQDFEDLEVIVVDDGTPNDSIREVVDEFPTVQYRRPPKNLGLIGARNFGAELCQGEYIINLDDDSWFIETDGVSKSVAIMDSDPTIGVLALNIGLRGTGYRWELDLAPDCMPFYTGCGNVYRRSILAKVGPYMAEFWRQGEESERSMRIMDAGYKILSAPSIRVFHDQSPINRDPAKHIALTAVNYLRRELLRAPIYALPYGVGRAFLWMLRRRKSLSWMVFWQEIWHKQRPLTLFLGSLRRPVKSQTYWKWWKMANRSEYRARA